MGLLSCAHHGIQGSGMSLWNLPCVTSLPLEVTLGLSQQGDLGSGISQQRSSMNSTSSRIRNVD